MLTEDEPGDYTETGGKQCKKTEIKLLLVVEIPEDPEEHECDK